MLRSELLTITFSGGGDHLRDPAVPEPAVLPLPVSKTQAVYRNPRPLPWVDGEGGDSIYRDIMIPTIVLDDLGAPEQLFLYNSDALKYLGDGLPLVAIH